MSSESANSPYPDLAAHSDRIMDFTVGSPKGLAPNVLKDTAPHIASDRLDISELLLQAGYDGADPVADDYVSVNPLSENSLEILFDGDGVGERSGNTIAVLENVDSTSFQNDIDNQLIFTPTEF